MTKRLLSILLLSAAFPLAASAQTSDGAATTAPAAPGIVQDDAATTNQNNAAGEMNNAQPMEQTADAGNTTEGPFVTVPSSGAWRVSDFEGKSVYGSDGESIGEINDVLVSQDGSVNAVIIGVGGFLGIGEKDVAVDMSALELGPGATQQEADQAAMKMEQQQAVSDETTASTAAGTATTPAGGATTGAGTDTAMTNDNAATGNTTTGTGMPATGDNAQMAANNANTIQIGEDGLPDRIVLNVTRQQLEDAPAFEGVQGNMQEQQ